MKKIKIFDSTLRDGAQSEGISFTVEDKIRIVKKLDELGVSYVEAGNPGSNQKDMDFFRKAKELDLKSVTLTAFGSTRRANIDVEDDKNVVALLSANTDAVAIFGKAWDFHVEKVIKTTNEENLKMIFDTLSFFKEKGKEIIFDAEHFFDGYKGNSDYAIEVCKTARDAGASVIVLCDTNGGTMPLEIFEITKNVVEEVDGCAIGIHCHNDSGMAVANSVMAVDAGAVHVQGTINGIGERTGNANLSTIIPTLQLKKDYSCIPSENIRLLTKTSRYISEIANMIPSENAPYVGKSAFAHKGGMHIDGVNKDSKTFEHIDPKIVGNDRRFLMSEQAGRSLLLKKIQKIDDSLEKESPETVNVMSELKKLEHKGYTFEEAEASFELRTKKLLGLYTPFFDLKHFKVNIDEPCVEKHFSSSAIIKVTVDGTDKITAAEGDGPVNALDKALRKVLVGFYPELEDMSLTDFKVRVIDAGTATAARVRVIIRSSDNDENWTTVGVSTDIIEASWIALVDSIEYKLYKDRK